MCDNTVPPTTREWLQQEVVAEDGPVLAIVPQLNADALPSTDRALQLSQRPRARLRPLQQLTGPAFDLFEAPTAERLPGSVGIDYLVRWRG
eukprot:scaffold40763_cov61-Phaeocystis_antarctica.AAC.3